MQFAGQINGKFQTVLLNTIACKRLKMNRKSFLFGGCQPVKIIL